MAFIDVVIPEKVLNTEYNSAKIAAMPFDYKISERLLLKSSNECFDKYNIFTKTNNSEYYLADLLGLDTSADYCELRDCLNVPKNVDIPANLLSDLCEIDVEAGTCGSMISYNNLIINEEILLNDLAYAFNPADPLTNVRLIKSLQTQKYLKALEFWFFKMIDKSSLIPSLLYLNTEYNSYSLQDIENIEFAADAIRNKLAPIVECKFGYMPMVPSSFLATASVPFVNMSNGHNTPDRYAQSQAKFTLASTPEMSEILHKLGLSYALSYGCELLYIYDKITDLDLKETIAYLLSINQQSSTFCSDFLYSYTSNGDLEINQEVKDCFDSDNEKRFDNFRFLVSKRLRSTEFSKEYLKNIDYFALPVFFARMVINAHAYAYQICRIKHATLLYNEAKNAGVLDKETFKQSVSGNNQNSGGIFGNENMPNELLNLGILDGISSNVSDDELVTNEKEVSSKRKDTGPSLSSADILKKDLYGSRYDYDIKYVKKSVENKDAYNVIASKITMITHNLTKQIKEIKTYNTGGKQNGLLTGKLDKKNLWKYKTDAKIFYNNNYKVKEMDLAFGCILDESGSMMGEKIKNGRIVMIMLHEVLNSLGINHSIIGHNSNSHDQVNIYKYFQFKEESFYNLEKPYSIVKASPSGCNCDSGVLFYMQKVMKAVRNKDKIVIIFSDGQPTNCTDLDLMTQVRTMEKEGIHVIGVGINFESIKDYYPDNANGKNLKDMVDIVVSILKRYVLEKKED